MTVYNDELYHYGVKGMRWGHRKARQIEADPSDTKVTKRVKNDYNNMSNRAFKRKYRVSKGKYSRRVDKYGDPYKRITSINRATKEINASQKGKASYLWYGPATSRKAAKYMVDKGMNQNQALKKAKRFENTAALSIVAGALAVTAIKTGAAKAMYDSGKSFVKNAYDNYNNVSIMDKSGKTIAKYHDAVKVGSQVVDMVLRKR